MLRFTSDSGSVRLLKRRGKLLLVLCVLLTVVNLSGVLIHPFEEDLSDNFSYPLDRPDFRELLDQRMHGHEVDVKPINSYDYRLLIKNSDKCIRANLQPNAEIAALAADDTHFPRLVFIIKSSLNNRMQRDTIRKTWGFEERFSDVPIRRVFVLGSCDSQSGQVLVSQMSSYHGKNSAPASLSTSKSCQDIIDEENHLYQDIVQADFIDSYDNNTIKTMIGLKWLSNTCPDAEFALFVDDDYYVSTKNLLKFVRDPFAEQTDSSLFDFDGRLYAGFVFANSSPMRHKISKWYISLDEYPYAKYPPYVSAGAYVLSNRAFKELHVASAYVEHFRFDDIYMGILAKKIGLTPTHSSKFHFYKQSYDASSYSSVIASHGFSDVQELSRVWNEQKALGNS